MLICFVYILYKLVSNIFILNLYSSVNILKVKDSIDRPGFLNSLPLVLFINCWRSHILLFLVLSLIFFDRLVYFIIIFNISIACLNFFPPFQYRDSQEKFLTWFPIQICFGWFFKIWHFENNNIVEIWFWLCFPSCYECRLNKWWRSSWDVW